MSKTFIEDLTTRNSSFLQTALSLKRLGIKNNRFFLKLYDRRLKGVDPHDPDLTQDQIIWIIDECIRNPWYFLRECARIPMQGGGGMSFALHRANLAQIFCFLLGIDHYVVIPRQKGKTQSALAIIDWAFLFGTSHSDFAMINKRSEDAEANLYRLKAQRDLLPPYMQQKIAFHEETGKELKETNNVRSLRNPSNNNRIRTKTSASSDEAADGIGRGASEPIQYFDEVEYTPYIKTIVEAGGPAYMVAARNAKRNNAAHCRIFTSTPGDVDSQPGRHAAEIINKTTKWSEQMYDWDIERIHEYVDKTSENGIVYIEYSYTQLGEGQEWFDLQCKALNNSPVKIKRELLLKRIRGSDDSPYDAEDLEALQDMKGDIVEEFFINQHNIVYLYEKLVRSKIYIVGVDVASGYGIKHDRSAVVIFDPYSEKVVGEFKSPHISEDDLAKFLFVLVKKHIPKAIVVVERNKGGTVIEWLRKSPIGMQVFYDSNNKIFDLDDTLDNQGFLQRESEKRRMFGVWTGPKTRERMFSILYALVREKKENFVSGPLISEVSSLVLKGTKIVAGPGAHDDIVMAYLMCIYVFYHASNLSKWGFHKGAIPDEEKRNQGLHTYEEIIEQMSSESREYFENSAVATKTADQYDDYITQELLSARREAYQFDMLTKPVNRAENIEEMDDDFDINLDLFDDLNS